MRALSPLVAICLSVCLAAAAFAATKPPTKKLQFDPTLPVADVFDAMDAGTVETTVVARNSNEANLFVTNKNDAPVSIKLPPAMVAVQVLKQQFPGQQNRFGGPQMAGGNMMGGAQPMGVGQNNQGMNNNMQNGFPNNGNGNGNGIFSVPPQKTVQVPLKGLCLAEGKRDPRPQMTYKLVKLEVFTSDPALQETLKLFTAGETDILTAQAAVWHLTNNMSWDQLRAKEIDRLGGLTPVPYFSDKQIEGAEKMIEEVRKKVASTPRRPETAAR